MLLLSIGRALTAPALSALVSRKANLGQGLTLSTSQSFDALARTFGPITAGGLFNYFGPAAPYVVSAFVMAGALVLTLARRTQMDAAAPAPPMPGDSPVATADAITVTASGVATER
jgi:predicted MFS family arabinose efflux permease